MLRFIYSVLVNLFGIDSVNTSADIFFATYMAILAVFVFALLILFVRKIKSLAFFGG